MKRLIASLFTMIMTFVSGGLMSMAAETTDAPAATVEETATIMGQGMLGIFIVMVLIYIVIILLNKTTNK